MNSENENLYEVGEDNVDYVSTQIEREEIREIIGNFDYSFTRDYYENWGGDY